MNTELLSAISAMNQYTSMSRSLQRLLRDTLCRVKPGEALYNELPLLFDAARDINGIVEGTYSQNRVLLEEALYGVSNIGASLLNGNLPSAIWSTITSIVSMDYADEDSLLNDDKRITFAAVSSDVCLLAYKLLIRDSNAFSDANLCLGREDTAMQENLRMDIILCLKASLTARQQLLATGWLPDRPAAEPDAAAASLGTVAGTAVPDSPRATRTATLAGLALLACFALWGLSEDSLWAVAATMGADQAGLDDTGMGLVLSLSTLGGLAGSALVALAGRRLGRTIPLAVVLVAGAAMKFISGMVEDSGLYMVVIIVWNTLYLIAFVYIIAIAAALDASGKWSAPALGVYLIGSSFAPFMGTAVSASAGYEALGILLAVMTLVLLVPFVLISRYSVRAEKAAAAVPVAAVA